MIPINSRCLKEEEECPFRSGREGEARSVAESRGCDNGVMGELCAQPHNPMDGFMEGYFKNPYEQQDPHNFMAFHHE